LQKASVFNIETFFGWVSTSGDFRRAFAQTEAVAAKEKTP
jgi:ureidoacrylate peracid hydrolase